MDIKRYLDSLKLQDEDKQDIMGDFLVDNISKYVDQYGKDLFTQTEKSDIPQPKTFDEFKGKIESFKKGGNDKLVSDQVFGNEGATSYYMVALEYYDKHSNLFNKEQQLDQLNSLMSIICTNASLCLANSMEIERSFDLANRAIQFNPNNPKAHFRRGYCLQKFVDFEESNKEFKAAIDCCTATDKSLSDIIQKEYTLQETKIEKMLEEKENIKARIESDTQFQEFPVYLTWIAGEGRCIVAKEDIPSGTSLLRVAPFTQALEDFCETTYCGSCSRPCKDIEHEMCKLCSRHVLCYHCKDDKTILERHKDECDILQFLTQNYKDAQSRDFRFMTRLVLAAVRNRNGTLTKEKSPETWKSKPFIFDSYQDLLNLSRNQNQITRKQMDAFKRGVDSIFALFKLVKPANYLNGINREDILNAYSIIQLNGHEILHPLHDSCGFGIYPTASYLNHSCDPNSCWYFDENGMITISNFREIKKGEEITITYVDTTYPLSTRRKDLLETYHFFCRCSKCKKDSLGDVGFVCQACKTPVQHSSLRYNVPEISVNIKQKLTNPNSNQQSPIFNATGKLYTCNNCNVSYDSLIFDMGLMSPSLKCMILKKPNLAYQLYGNYNYHFNEPYHTIRGAARENDEINKAIDWTRKGIENYEKLGGTHPWTTLGTYYYLLRYLKKQNKPETLNERIRIADTIRTNIEKLIKLDSNYYFTYRINHKLKISDS